MEHEGDALWTMDRGINMPLVRHVLIGGQQEELKEDQAMRVVNSIRINLIRLEEEDRQINNIVYNGAIADQN